MLTRDKAVAQLRAIARKVESVGLDEVRAHGSHRVYASLLHHFGSLEAARAEAGVPAPRHPSQRWNQQLVLDELRRAHRAGIRLTTRGLETADQRGLVNAAATYCGSLPRARRLAKLPEPAPILYERVRWDADTVVAEIRALAREGACLAASAVPTKLINAARYHLGGWEDAVEAAGFDYDRVRLQRAPYGRGELADMLRRLAKRRPNLTLAALHDHAAAEAWKREFGSIEDAARAAGLDDWPRRRAAPLLARDRVLAGIRARHRDGAPLASYSAERDDVRLHRSAVRRFGAWHAAVIAAGLPASAIEQATGVRRRWTKTSVRDALRARRRAGKSMSPSALRDDDNKLFQAARTYLGYDSTVAVREWGASRLRISWTKQEVIDRLHASGRSGERPPAALGAAARELFGSMRAARAAAGMPALRVEWSDEDVLGAIRALQGERPSRNLVSIASRRFGTWRAALAAAGVAAKAEVPVREL